MSDLYRKELIRVCSSKICIFCGEKIPIRARCEKNSDPTLVFDSDAYYVCLSCREYYRTHTEMADYCEKHGIQAFTEMRFWKEKYKNTEIKTEADKKLFMCGFQKKEDDLFFSVFERVETTPKGLNNRIVTIFFDKKKLMIKPYAISYEKNSKLCFDYSDFFLEENTLKACCEKLEEIKNAPDFWKWKKEENNEEIS